MAQETPHDGWRGLYSFASHFALSPDGLRQHYVDEGEGRPCVLLHGIPTWSFMYRDLVRALAAAGRRAIAPDLIGCGLSEKPQSWNYCLANQVKTLGHLLDEEMRLSSFDLVVHDWGGPIGLGYAVRHPERIGRLVIMDTAAFTSSDCPVFARMLRTPFLGAFLARRLNLLVEGALRLAARRRLPPVVREGYRFPYGNYRDRIATQRFAQDLPFSPAHQTWNVLKEIEQSLGRLADKPVLLCWGGKDFCFHEGFLRRWQSIFPGAQSVTFPDAGHYLLEDDPESIIPLITGFIAGENPIS